jgi:hypothetical protein
LLSNHSIRSPEFAGKLLEFRDWLLLWQIGLLWKFNRFLGSKDIAPFEDFGSGWQVFLLKLVFKS